MEKYFKSQIFLSILAYPVYAIFTTPSTGFTENEQSQDSQSEDPECSIDFESIKHRQPSTSTTRSRAPSFSNLPTNAPMDYSDDEISALRLVVIGLYRFVLVNWAII